MLSSNSPFSRDAERSGAERAAPLCHNVRHAQFPSRSLLLAVIGVLVAWWTLSPAAQPTGPAFFRSAQSGPWSDQKTWEGGKIPTAGARVQIRPGHTVIYDVAAGPAIRFIHVAGILTFARDKSTTLETGLIAIQPGDDPASEDGFDCDAHAPEVAFGEMRPALEVGTPNEPLDAKFTATIRLRYFEGQNKQSCPAIVCCGGRMDFHGAPLNRTWLKLGANAKKGDTVVVLSDTVTGWKAGDSVLITATRGLDTTGGTRRPGANNRLQVYTEVRTIKQLDGLRVTLDKPLEADHCGSGDYRGALANLSRNVVVESAQPDGLRGHTMYHRGSAGAISYAEFRHLGKEDVLGRYSIHYHLCGSTMRGSYVIGASIWDSHNRWVTIHGTNYLVVRDCVGYQSVGHGFFLENGKEVYNVLDRNLAVQAFRAKPLPQQALPFDANDGAGFWWANSYNTFTGNSTCENDRYGYRFEATPGSNFKPLLPILAPEGILRNFDIRTLPFVRFVDNEAACDGKYGFNLGEGVQRVGPDRRHMFVIRNTKIWDVHYAFRPQSPSVYVDNMRIWRCTYGVYHPNYDDHFYKDLYIGETSEEPFNRGHDDDSIQYGLLVVDGLTFEKIPGGDISMIQISDTNATGQAVSHFRNVKVIHRADGGHRALVDLGGGARPEPKSAAGVPIFLHDWYGPNKTAKVVSIKARELTADGLAYKQDPPLTGDASRVAVVEMPFPKMPDLVDDQPPATVMTHVQLLGNKLLVRGTTSDNGTVVRVLVNNREAKPVRQNFAEWEIVLTEVPPGNFRVAAHGEDAAGNIERMPHEVVFPIGK
jgi:G8 domain